MTTVAVLGAGGTMGLPMARNLARAGFAVRGWNRTREKAEPLERDGARLFDTPAEAAAGADVLVTMLADAGAVLAVARDALGGAPAPAVWLQMSTIGEEGTDRCAELARGAGVDFVDAPVLGTKEPAEQGKLVVLAGGARRLRERVQPVLDAVGRRTLWMDEPGCGTRLKLVANTWVLTVVEGGAEAIALAEGMGVDPALLLEAVEGGPLDLPYLRTKGRAIAARDFRPSFRLALAAKDARLVDESARRRGLDLPLVEVIRRRMEQGAERHGDKDMSATYLTSAPRPA